MSMLIYSKSGFSSQSTCETVTHISNSKATSQSGHMDILKKIDIHNDHYISDMPYTLQQ